MSEASTLGQRLTAHFGDKIAAVHEFEGETTLDVLPENWLALARALRDDDAFHYELLIDVCGVDYLSYGQVEWDTTDVSSQGFSRGVEGEGRAVSTGRIGRTPASDTSASRRSRNSCRSRTIRACVCVRIARTTRFRSCRR